jgi:LPXTG-site transpeptidase (sortase) family protein
MKISWFNSIVVLILFVTLLATQKIDPTRAASSKHIANKQTNFTWLALPNGGLDAGYKRVMALTEYNKDLFVAGYFSQTTDGSLNNLNNIARFNTASQTWNALPHDGLSGGAVKGEIRSLEIIGDNLYVGGWAFNQTADGAVTNLNNIARYNITTQTWHALANNGLNNIVMAMLAVGDDLYVAGSFNKTADGTINFNHIARLNTTTNTWENIGGFGSGEINALALAGDNLFIGGNGLNQIARFNLTSQTWHPLPSDGLNSSSIPIVTSLTTIDNDLYVGGRFEETGDGTVKNLNQIARFDITTQAWQALPNNGLSGYVTALKIINNNLFVGGQFSQTSDGKITNLNNIARFDLTTQTWNALPNGGFNNGFVEAFSELNSDIYVGGGFDSTFDRAIKLYGIAKLINQPILTDISSLPKTGFTPKKTTLLPAKPVNISYSKVGNIWLEIPSLNIKSDIVGVPQSNNAWDVKWLGRDVGWLNGTAFPTWQGNSVITGHVYDANGLPGIFVDLKNLKYGDKIIIHLGIEKYIFEVRKTKLVSPNTTGFAFEHLENRSFLTLITCAGFNEKDESYRFRRIIRAVLVSVESE